MMKVIGKLALIAFERKVAKLWEEGKIKVPVHLSGGNERELIKIFKKIKPEDYVFSTHRNHYHYLLKGGKEEDLLNEILQEQGSMCDGNSGSMHTIDTRINFYSSAIVAGCCAIAVGVAWVIREKRANRHVWCFIGDGATDEGHFYEAVRYAVGHDLPVTFVIEDNNRSTCTTNHVRWGIAHPAELGFGCSKVIYYSYKPRYPHVGTGKYVQF